MTRGNGKWTLNRTVNLSVLVQLAFLASLIVGSWVNLQRQLDSLQRDVTSLLESQKSSADKVETLQEKVISHEFRIRIQNRKGELRNMIEGGGIYQPGRERVMIGPIIHIIIQKEENPKLPTMKKCG